MKVWRVMAHDVWRVVARGGVTGGVLCGAWRLVGCVTWGEKKSGQRILLPAWNVRKFKKR
jgi:hypothetical protein